MSKRLVFSRTSPLPVDANRAFLLPPDGWFQLAAPGEAPAPMESPDDPEAEPVDVVQVFDAEAANRVLAKFREVAAAPNFGGLLVDFEHFSYEKDKETRAAAWIDDMQVRNGAELWIKPRITNSGREALEGGDYRHISPVFLYLDRDYKSGDRVRPEMLDTAGLTNRPRIKGMKPLSNRQTAATAERKQTQPEKPMKTLLKLLGLAEDASEESAVAACQVIKNRADTVEPITKERDTLLAATIERDLDDAGLEGEARTPWKIALVKNRADTLPLLAGVKAAKPAPARGGEGYRVVHNRATAATPAAVTKGNGKATETPRQIRNREIRTYQDARNASFETAYAAVKSSKPELFQEEEPAAE